MSGVRLIGSCLEHIVLCRETRLKYDYDMANTTCFETKVAESEPW